MFGSDKWFKWCFNVFVFLMCVQLGMLLFLKSLFYQAEQRMADNTAQVSFTCGDHNTEKAYWPIVKSAVQKEDLCENKKNCPESLWVNPSPEEHQLHVLSVVRPRPSFMENGKVEPGHFIDVQLQSLKNPTTLVLISQTMLQWNIEFVPPELNSNFSHFKTQGDNENLVVGLSEVIQPSEELPEDWKQQSISNLKEVIVVGPELVWLDGLSKETKVTYFSKDQLCAYPIAWEELANSENEFRRLALALREYTNLEISSFQGKKVGRYFKVPFVETIEKNEMVKTRGLSSVKEEKKKSSLFSNGIHWKRFGKTLLADHFELSNKGEIKKLNLPEKTMQAHYDKGSDQLFVIRNFHFGVWDSDNQSFKPIRAPLTLPALRWPTAMTFNPYRSELFIYNDDRGGEIFIYNVVTQSWKVFAQKVGYSLVGLHFDRQAKSLLGIRFQGHKIPEILRFNQEGETLKPHRLVKPLDFTKNKWRAHLVQNSSNLWLKVSHPAEPEGELYPLMTDGETL